MDCIGSLTKYKSRAFNKKAIHFSGNKALKLKNAFTDALGNSSVNPKHKYFSDCYTMNKLNKLLLRPFEIWNYLTT